MSGGLYRYYQGNWWETKVALYLKKNSLILCESDLGAGHPLGQCCLRSRERCRSGSKSEAGRSEATVAATSTSKEAAEADTVDCP